MYKQRDILMIPIPFTDLTASKKRPVLVLSTTTYNSKTDDLLVAAITSNISLKEYEVKLSTNDLAEGILPVVSCVRADKIYTLSQKIVVKKFGEVKDHLFIEVCNRLTQLIEKE